MATMHFEKNPYQRDLFGIPEEEINNKFPGWQEKAHYSITTTVIIQIDTTNVSQAEYNIAPNITFITTNTAIVNIYRTHSFTGSFPEFQAFYSSQEQSLQLEIEKLVNDLNTARAGAGKTGSWYVNYGLNDRIIKVSKA